MQTSSAALVEGDEIMQLLPQRPPFVMVGKLLYSDETRTVSSFPVTSDNLFITTSGYLAEPAIIENIAQTAALRIGYSFFLEKQKGHVSTTPHIGFIGGITGLKIKDLPPIGSEIKTEIIFEKEIMDVVLIKGTVWLHEIAIAECQMKLFIKKD